ncbi:hypothetical protein L6452_41125 [Arctium lappa]|uniref:Uncharacterized protein n=1 Tax=Arctium lappa TaxID=4217 RepID=A0ACB8XMW3_ARCLA|nr:hypothetical protein L6452_41125 [Arctium lappa]
MIKNIPNKYSQKLLLNMLEHHCIHCKPPLPLSSYDFVYLPIDFMNKCNVGYGFVNMTEAIWRLYNALHHQNWEVFNSKKICEVSYTRLQGVDALKENAEEATNAKEVESLFYAPLNMFLKNKNR